jgi:2-polyprenyl-3-methyl-5-hydroxy-6-metoxy-1,4-benzoquinol methylase
MPTDPSFSLTQNELSLIEAHLREQYQGVFDDKMIQAHLHEFVESSFADSLAAVIAGSSQPGESMLDIGAGYGAFVLSCRRHGLDAIGFELAPFEVEISRKRLKRFEPTVDAATIFRRGDAGQLPFSDNEFQIVALLNVLEHVPNYQAVLREAVRVLHPGGRLFVVCPVAGCSSSAQIMLLYARRHTITCRGCHTFHDPLRLGICGCSAVVLDFSRNTSITVPIMAFRMHCGGWGPVRPASTFSGWSTLN